MKEFLTSLPMTIMLLVLANLAISQPAKARPWYCSYCTCADSCDRVCNVTNTLESTCGEETGICENSNYCGGPPPVPPAAAVSVELTEETINEALATLTQARGINFGEYQGGFLDAWWGNLNSATADIIAQTGNSTRLRLNASATFNVVFDLFIINVPIVGQANGWIEGDVQMTGDALDGYQLEFEPTDLDLNAWLQGLPVPVQTLLTLYGNTVLDLPTFELTLGTQLQPDFVCAPPNFGTRSDLGAFVLEWDLEDLDCRCGPVEICNNNQDDDCDGQVDEGCQHHSDELS